MGMVFWELAEGRGALPWGDANIFKIRDLVGKELKRPPIPAATPTYFADLIVICWRDHPMHRPSAADVFFRVQDIANQVNGESENETIIFLAVCPPAPPLLLFQSPIVASAAAACSNINHSS